MISLTLFSPGDEPHILILKYEFINALLKVVFIIIVCQCYFLIFTEIVDSPYN